MVKFRNLSVKFHLLRKIPNENEVGTKKSNTRNKKDWRKETCQKSRCCGKRPFRRPKKPVENSKKVSRSSTSPDKVKPKDK